MTRTSSYVLVALVTSVAGCSSSGGGGGGKGTGATGFGFGGHSGGSTGGNSGFGGVPKGGSGGLGGVPKGGSGGVGGAVTGGSGGVTGCADTCQFANDGTCDEPNLCDPGTDCSDCTGGSGGSSGSGGLSGSGGGSGGTVAPDHEVTCTSTGHVDPEWCTCTGDSNTGKTVINGTCQKDPTFAPMTCCADSNFPNSGSCTCYLSQAWRCSAFTSSCYCDYFWTQDDVQYFTSVCDNLPGSDGHPWRCCLSKAGSCNCEEDGAPCQAGDTEVSNCVSDTALGLTPFYGCGSGQSQVGGCSNIGAGGSGNCTSDTQCPGSCTGSDPVCCPVCKSTGNCGMYCCDSSGNCF